MEDASVQHDDFAHINLRWRQRVLSLDTIKNRELDGPMMGSEVLKKLLHGRSLRKRDLQQLANEEYALTKVGRLGLGDR
jgi:hypothetical protein